MDDTQINELNEILRRLAASVGTTVDELDEHGNALDAEQVRVQRRNAAIEAEAKKAEAAFDKQIEALNRSIAGLTRFGNSLTSAPGSFGPLNDMVGATTKIVSNLASAMGPLGKAAGAVVSALGEVAQMVVQQFEKAYGTFEKLAESGVVVSFEDMRDAGSALGLTFADTERVLSKSGKELAALGGSAITGRLEFEKIAAGSEDMRRNFQKLGISAADFSEFQMSYVSQQQRINRGQTKTTQEQIDGTKQYIQELDVLSKLTGVSRKQLQSEQEARMRDVRYRAGIASLGKDQKEQIDQFLGVLKQTAPQIEEGMKDLIATGGAPVTEAGRAALLSLEQGGLNVQQVVEGLRTGSIKGFDAFQKVAGAAGKAADATEDLAKITGDQTILTKTFVDLRELEARRSSMTQAEYEKLKKQLTSVTGATKGQNAELANAKMAMYNAGRNIELLATTSDFATKAISMMADGIEYVTEKMYELAGKELPAHLKTRREERKAIEEETKARKKAETSEAAFKSAAVSKEKYAKAEEAYLQKQQEIDDLQQNLSDAKTKEEKTAIEEKIKLARIESASRLVEANKAKKEFNQLNKLKTEAVAAAQAVEETKKKREEATKKRIGADAAAGIVRPEDKKAAEAAARPKELKEADDKIVVLQKENDSLASIAAGEKLKFDKVVAEEKDLEEKLEQAKKENNQEAVTELTKDLADKKQEYRNMLKDTSQYSKITKEYEAHTLKLERAKQDRINKEIELKAKEALAARATGTPVAAAPALGTAQPASVAPAITGKSKTLAERIIEVESGGRNIANQSGAGGKATSSAFGLAQFTKGTFEGLVKGAGKDNPLYGKTFDDYKKDTDLQREALSQLMDSNRKILAAGKVSTSDAAIYLAHFLGATGATNVLKSSDSTPLSDVVSANQIAANPHLMKMSTVADIKNWADKKMGGGGYPLAAANGALINPTPGGTLVQVAEAGQAEAIVPLPDGRSIPVTISNSNEQTEILAKLFSNMSGKLDTMIDLLSTGNRTQRNIAQNLI